ncbi:MAG: L-glutamate gamma-semialdehyde dehydrogenase [Caldilineae bacterium]|nr:L-glutamate gamma-semialdehyde dehydrogenase [Chloroflexota bacterium]MCB9177692.1 L-glutamate gamma-semialdehyde dehydrogenase [Caldilineae bacterium]
MNHAIVQVPRPTNEPVRAYAPGSPERASLQARLQTMRAEQVEIPAIIGGREVRTGQLAEIHAPHETSRRLGSFHQCGAVEAKAAVEAALAARESWARMPWEHRAAVFLRAADLLAGPWRDTLNAATMLGQSKNVFQAEIDAACELIDFFRFNVWYAQQIYAEQPGSSPGVWNQLAYRPLEGFVFAVPPFNFTSIAGNLPAAPALMGNAVVWKPASTAVFSGWYIYRLLEAAGLPPGVINFVPGSGGAVGDPVLSSQHLAGLHFTGSTATFQHMWRTIGGGVDRYRTYPRIVGETGGKDFVVAHASADVDALVTGLIRGAFEYQGQKCSAASRAYIPDSLWPRVRQQLADTLAGVRMGPVEDFGNFVNAVIDRGAFDSITGYIERARADGIEILSGGGHDASEGWYVEPTVLVAEDPMYRTMCEEIFGPVLSLHVYPEARWAETLELVDRTSPYSLTGAIFADDRSAVVEASNRLENAAGNFYINDKPTGAVVGQQPFGGARASGTNDKAGSYLNLVRWVSARTVKETFVPPRDYRYPFLGPDA